MAVFRGLATGQWTVTATDGKKTDQKTVAITADYSTTITLFEATIHVTYPAGAVCTATDGVTTLAAPDTSGTWDCVVIYAGNWTFKLDNGFEETVSILNDGQTVTLDKWYLYNKGTFKNITEFNPYAYGPKTSSSKRIAPTQTVGSNSIELSISIGSSGNAAGICASNKKVDLTNYGTLNINVNSAYTGNSSNTSYIRIGVLDAIVDNFTPAAAKAIAYKGSSITSDTIISCDISSLTGRYYVIIALYGNTNQFVKFDQIFMTV